MEAVYLFESSVSAYETALFRNSGDYISYFWRLATKQANS